MRNKVLIFGSGSIALRHYSILKNNFNQLSEINFFTKRKILNIPTIKNLREVKKFSPDYFIIASRTSEHYKYLKFIDTNFRNKKVLIEKPLFHKYINKLFTNNDMYVGYNLRFHPIIKKIRNYIKTKKIYSVDIICNSYLPKWRKNINYSKSSSSLKKYGGGVLLDLSHELDYSSLLFGELQIISVLNKKISNLKINTDDYLTIQAISNKNIYINISINYFSKISTRLILINGENFAIKSDLINNSLEISDNKNKKTNYRINNNYTYKMQHHAILKNKKDTVCDYENGLKILQLIEKIRKKR